MYAAIADMQIRFGLTELLQLTDPALSGIIDSAVVQTALDDAGCLINGYIASRVKLPLVNVPALLVQLECDIARYRLYKDVITDEVKRRHGDAVRTLEGISAGRVDMGLDAAAHEVSESPVAMFGSGSAGQVFGGWRGF